MPKKAKDHSTLSKKARRPTRKISRPDMIKIKKLYVDGEFNQPQLAKMFGVTKGRISQICRKDWDTEPEGPYKDEITALHAHIEDRTDMRHMWMKALSNSHLEPAMKKLFHGIPLNDEEKKTLREGGKVYTQMISSLDRKDQLQMGVNVQINIQLTQVRTEITTTILHIVEELAPAKYAEILERLIEIEGQEK